MTTSKYFSIIGLILTLALPGALLAGSVNGADWYSVKPGNTTNQLEQVISFDSTVAYSGIGMDWYNGGEVTFVKPNIESRSFSTNIITAIGRDWHSEEATTSAGSTAECLAISANINSGVENC